MRTMRVGILGCGHVGGALLGLLDTGRAEIAERSGVDLEVVRVGVRDLARSRSVGGEASTPARRTPSGVKSREEEGARWHQRSSYPDSRFTDDLFSIAEDDEVDIVVELIGGLKPARELILAALCRGKPVVTANKELLARSGRELEESSRHSGRSLLFEAAVAGAIPLVRALGESLVGDSVRRVIGIVNGTTNFILTQMAEQGLSYEAALSLAIGLGYAEQEPSADVEGYDAAAKAAILAGLAFNADVTVDDVYREGIVAVTNDDIALAQRLGYEVKLLAVIEREARPGVVGPEKDSPRLSVRARVHPAMVSRVHPLAGVRGQFNAVFIESDAAGELMLYGQGAGGLPTASAVLGDVIDAAHSLTTKSSARPVFRRTVEFLPIEELRTEYCVYIDVLDQPGVLGAVATIFGEHGVSIRWMEQFDLSGEARLVFLTHIARESDLRATLADLEALAVVERVGQVLRVHGQGES